MLFQVNLADAKPVYLQLMDQVKFAIASGRLKPDDRLPPVRDVAVQARINRNTVARVYAELEREGLVYTRSGQGTFVSGRASTVNRTEQRRQLASALDELLAQAKLYGLSREQLMSLIEDRMDTIFTEPVAKTATGRKR